MDPEDVAERIAELEKRMRRVEMAVLQYSVIIIIFGLGYLGTKLF